MTTQLLIRYDLDNAAKWQAAFDAHAEDRANNGLTTLQVWHEGENRRWALFQVGNATNVRNWLASYQQLFNPQAGVASSEHHMLETA